MGSSHGVPVLREADVTALSETSGMEKEEVKEAFQEFLELHPKGRMKHKDFLELMTKALPGKDAQKMEKHVFRMYDYNADGYIDFVEFMVIFHIMCDGSPQDILGKVFRVFDVNSDGVIARREMDRLVKDMYGLVKAQDPQAQSKKLIAKCAFSEMDADRDGRITLEEFNAAILSQEELSKMLATKVIDLFLEE